MNWSIGDNRNLFLMLKARLGLYLVELKSKDSPEKITLTLVETQQLPDLEKADSKGETLSTLHLQLCRLLKQYVFDCAGYRAN